MSLKRVGHEAVNVLMWEAFAAERAETRTHGRGELKLKELLLNLTRVARTTRLNKLQVALEK